MKKTYIAPKAAAYQLDMTHNILTVTSIKHQEGTAGGNEALSIGAEGWNSENWTDFGEEE